MTEGTAKIVVIEDDATIRAILEMALLGAGYTQVTTCARGDEGLATVKRLKPDLVILDLMLPGLDGFSICSRIRETSSLALTRIIMLTARTQNEDIVRGLSCGADDYVVKPFDRLVLLARVKAVLRRAAPATEGVSFDGLLIDPETHAVSLKGREVKLSAGEFTLLERLVSHRGRILPRDALDRTMDVQVATLRRKLGAWADHIETIRGVGYRVRT